MKTQDLVSLALVLRVSYRRNSISADALATASSRLRSLVEQAIIDNPHVADGTPIHEWSVDMTNEPAPAAEVSPSVYDLLARALPYVESTAIDARERVNADVARDCGDLAHSIRNALQAEKTRRELAAMDGEKPATNHAANLAKSLRDLLDCPDLGLDELEPETREAMDSAETALDEYDETVTSLGDFLLRVKLTDEHLPADFKRAVSLLQRPYLPISEGQSRELDRMTKERGDIIVLDGRRMTWGEADGGFALMPLRAK